MAVRRLAAEQPQGFAFTDENLVFAKAQIAKYPQGREASAVIPLLWRAQEQEGWISEPAIRAVADMLGMAYIRVLEVATFYTMFHLHPVGTTAHIQVCGTTPCMLRGAEEIVAVCKRRIAEAPHTRSADGRFSWEEVECLGACVNAPMVQMVKDTYEDLTAESFEALLDSWARGDRPVPGPQNGRTTCMPAGGATSLTDPALYDGTLAREMTHELEAAAAARALEAVGTAPQPAALAPAEPAPAPPAAKAKAAKAVEGEASLEDAERPPALAEPAGGAADDLKRIKGVGPKIEGILNGIGIFHFGQIAAWNEDNKAWVDSFLRFRGRIDREDWVGQAKVLAEGGETAFSRRVDEGDVPTSRS